MNRPRLLDLFCCAGGAAKGYHDAGFDVYGVDIEPQARYPYAFCEGDALTVMARLRSGDKVGFRHKDGRVEYLRLSDFAAIHASPPCQGYTTMRHAPGAIGAPCLIEIVKEYLIGSEKPYVIENVEGAAEFMPFSMTLCGTMFGLGANGADLWRHRLFISGNGLWLKPPCPCQHNKTRPTVGIYGGHARIRSAKHGGRGTRDAWPNGHKPVAAEAMGISWATLAEMSEAIPPAYTHHIGKQIMELITA